MLAIHSQSEETVSIAAWPELKELYVQLNKPLPASAAAERLFSCAGLTLIAADLSANIIIAMGENLPPSIFVNTSVNS